MTKEINERPCAAQGEVDAQTADYIENAYKLTGPETPVAALASDLAVDDPISDVKRFDDALLAHYQKLQADLAACLADEPQELDDAGNVIPAKADVTTEDVVKTQTASTAVTTTTVTNAVPSKKYRRSYGSQVKAANRPLPRDWTKKETKAVERLKVILSLVRGDNFRTEIEFVGTIYRTCKASPHETKYDAFGNVWVNVKKKDGSNSAVLWSCHTDTVARGAGVQPVLQTPDEYFVLANTDTSDYDCLGADDGVGVWLCQEMIRHHVPGLYIFHRGEEHGCQGSHWIAKNHADAIAEKMFAVAFDRKGYADVITHQRGRRCASDAFAKALALQLPAGFVPDNTGLVTDTASYMDLVAECTNLSIGYFNNHWSEEYQDIRFALDMRAALIKIDETKFVAVRKPGEDDPKPVYKPYVYSGGSDWRKEYAAYYAKTQKQDMMNGGVHGDNVRPFQGSNSSAITRNSGSSNSALGSEDDDDGYGWGRSNSKSLFNYIRNNPDVVEAYLEEQGLTLADLEEYEFSAYGDNFNDRF